jgi:4-amino-4-deoxychorismate lyase
MSLLFETIRLQDGEFSNLQYHAARLNRSRKALFGTDDHLRLETSLSVPENCKQGVFRCRVSYGLAIGEIQFEPYQKRHIESLRLVEDDSISYDFKFSDRTRLNQLFGERKGCDEILIIKHGLLTDTSFSNILFSDGRNWVTPASPLLRGTMREYLLKKGIIKESDITVNDLKKYTTARLINAMLPFGAGIDIPVENILYQDT